MVFLWVLWIQVRVQRLGKYKCGNSTISSGDNTLQKPPETPTYK